MRQRTLTAPALARLEGDVGDASVTVQRGWEYHNITVVITGTAEQAATVETAELIPDGDHVVLTVPSARPAPPAPPARPHGLRARLRRLLGGEPHQGQGNSQVLRGVTAGGNVVQSMGRDADGRSRPASQVMKNVRTKGAIVQRMGAEGDATVSPEGTTMSAPGDTSGLQVVISVPHDTEIDLNTSDGHIRSE
ncbi:hypothetical protein [Spirillospora sp. CA-128828]|uniref:hypothetical protein n=1 Tax=Spirillospora sp. CA-128828 TaxID=3240033 RepID=UPI003D8B629D